MSDIQRTNLVDNDAPTAAPVSESTIPTISEFNGRPTILLNPGSKYPFSLGMAKAKLVLRNVSFLQAFVDSEGTSVE